VNHIFDCTYKCSFKDNIIFMNILGNMSYKIATRAYFQHFWLTVLSTPLLGVALGRF
jgi:hypothetical protein